MPCSALTRRLLIAAAMLAVAGPALASGPPKKKEGEAAAPEPAVKLQPIAVPIIVDGKLLNYIFVNMTLKMAAAVPVTVMDGQEPLLRDAVVKAAHRTPFTASDTYVEVDAAKLKSAVMRETVILVGKGKVASVEITKQIARKQIPHPSGPKRAAAPASGGHAAPAAARH
ncbi:hypothetical protein [Caulobacter sp. DWR1-3-2b1]|uniref:hypothetical protein n=1 Tax=Caulobacter sp. DWR1-3-2b1 TaxID=2804670 RepID=UPI003CF523E4